MHVTKGSEIAGFFFKDKLRETTGANRIIRLQSFSVVVGACKMWKYHNKLGWVDTLCKTYLKDVAIDQQTVSFSTVMTAEHFSKEQVIHTKLNGYLHHILFTSAELELWLTGSCHPVAHCSYTWFDVHISTRKTLIGEPDRLSHFSLILRSTRGISVCWLVWNKVL